MKIKHALAALAACTLMSGTAVAFDGADGQGASAQAGSHGQAKQKKNREDRRMMRQQQRNEASTSTVGAAVTTRNGGAAAIDTRGRAAGTGTVRSSSEGEVFSSTTRDGSDADAFGRSEAEALERRRNRPQ